MEMLVWLEKAEQAVLKITFPNQMFSTKISNLTENDFLNGNADLNKKTEHYKTQKIYCHL